MKSFNKTILVLMAVIAVSLTSCKKDDDGGGGGDAQEGSLKASVAGNSFNSITAFAIRSGLGISITSADASQRSVGLTLVGVTETGTYQIGDGPNITISGSYIEIDANNPQNSQTWQAPYESIETGEVSISEISDTKIKGTFFFTAKNVNGDQSLREVTSGTFNLNFQ